MANNFNELILSNYQKRYPNLQAFSYDNNTDSLVYEGNYIRLNGNGLTKAKEIFFNLQPDDIFTYFKNGFYQDTNEALQIEALTKQMVITEEEVEFIKNYIRKYNQRLIIYARNKILFDKNIDNEDIRNFFQCMKDAKNLIDRAKNMSGTNNTYDIINDTWQNIQTSNLNETKSMDMGLSLTRKKEGFNYYQEVAENEAHLNELNKKQKLSIAGFTSIVIIVSTVVSAGAYLALMLLS